MRSLQEQRVFKWLGIFACVGLAVVWVGTNYAQTYFRLGYFNLSVDHGAICTWISDHSAPPKTRLTRERCNMRKWWPDVSIRKGDVGFDAPIWLVMVPVLLWTMRKWRIVKYAPERCSRCRAGLEGPNAYLCGSCRRIVSHKKLRRLTVIRWTGVSISVLLGGAWWVSSENRFTYSTRHHTYSANRWVWELEAGRIKATCKYRGTNVSVRPSPPLPTKMAWWPDVEFEFSGSHIYMPIWMLLLPLAAMTFLLWRYNPRSTGQCVSCGYDLTGNVSGTCPECGTEV